MNYVRNHHMETKHAAAKQGLSGQLGFSMLEILVTLLILLVGLLGLISLQARAHQAEMESYQRTQALILLQDIVDRINTNRKAASCFAVTTGAGSPFLGTGSGVTPSCAATGTGADAAATSSITQWNALLLGSAETQTASGTNIGAMVGARGCVALDAGNAVAVPPTPDVYSIAVAWEGLNNTVAPSVPAAAPAGLTRVVACGQNLYGNETRRRVVWTTVALGRLK